MSKEVFKKLREKYSKYGLVTNRLRTYKTAMGIVDVTILTNDKPKVDKRHLRNMNIAWITNMDKAYDDKTNVECYETTIHFWWL